MEGKESMRCLGLVLVLCSVIILSCRKDTGLNKPDPVSLSTPSSTEAAGGAAPKEPGDTSPEHFDGIAGIVDVKRSGGTPVVLRDIRTGKHPDFDRVVFEFEGNEVPGYHVEFVDKPVRTCGSGELVPIAGYGYLLVRMTPAQSHTNAGKPTLKQQSLSPNFPVIKELKQICDFEADVQWVMGLSHPNRYRVLELSNPSRLVVDIRH
jgi:hypothetical protein